MIYKLLILFQFIGFFTAPPVTEEGKVKAWIEIEGELDTMAVRAIIENISEENMFLSYELEMQSLSRIKNKKTLQKGKLMALRKSIIELSEARLNLRSTQKLCVRIRVLKDNKVIASDSVVFQGAR
jgi:hypothetical protein